MTELADGTGSFSEEMRKDVEERLSEARTEGKLQPRTVYFYVLYDWASRSLQPFHYSEESFLRLPSSRSDWERLYRCRVDLHPPVQGDLSTVKSPGVELYDESDALDLENESLAYAYGRRLWSQTARCLPTRPPDETNETQYNSWLGDPFEDRKDTTQQFAIQSRGKTLYVTIEETEGKMTERAPRELVSMQEHREEVAGLMATIQMQARRIGDLELQVADHEKSTASAFFVLIEKEEGKFMQLNDVVLGHLEGDDGVEHPCRFHVTKPGGGSLTMLTREGEEALSIGSKVMLRHSAKAGVATLHISRREDGNKEEAQDPGEG